MFHVAVYISIKFHRDYLRSDKKKLLIMYVPTCTTALFFFIARSS